MVDAHAGGTRRPLRRRELDLPTPFGGRYALASAGAHTMLLAGAIALAAGIPANTDDTSLAIALRTAPDVRMAETRAEVSEFRKDPEAETTNPEVPVVPQVAFPASEFAERADADTIGVAGPLVPVGVRLGRRHAAPPASPPSPGPSAARPTAPPRTVTAPPRPAPRPVLIPPRAIARECAEPKYPRVSRRLREVGDVLLEVQVDREGRPGRVRVLRSSGFARLDEAAAATLAEWRFHPALEDGVAIEGIVEVTIRFRLDAGDGESER